MPTFLLLRIQRNEFLPKASLDNPHPLPSVSVEFLPWLFNDEPVSIETLETPEEAFTFFKSRVPLGFRTQIAVQEKSAYEQSLRDLESAAAKRLLRPPQARSYRA